MQTLRLARSTLQKRASILAALLFLLASIGCHIRLIGDYDDAIDKGVTDVQQKAELYIVKLQSAPNTGFDQNFYDDINSRMAVLQSRAKSLEKYTLITQQLTNLKSQFDRFEELDKGMKRPFPQAPLAAVESGISVSVESILKLEFALKRGGAAPSAKTN